MGRCKRHGQHDRRETPDSRDAPADAPDAGISKIVNFGDSLTDAGALFAATGAVLTLPFPLADFGYSTQITSGLNHADVTPDLLGAEIANDAFGGAPVMGTRSLASAVAPGVAEAYLVEDADPDIPGQDITPGGESRRRRAWRLPSSSA